MQDPGERADSLRSLALHQRAYLRSELAFKKRKLEQDDDWNSPDEDEITSASSTSRDRPHRKRARTDAAGTGSGTDNKPDLRMFLTQLRNFTVPWIQHELDRLAKRQSEVPNTEESKEATLNILRQGAPEQVNTPYDGKVSQDVTSFFQGEINKLIDAIPLKKLHEQLIGVSEFAMHLQEHLDHSDSSANESISAVQRQIDGMKQLMGGYERRLDQISHQQHAQAGRGRHLTSLGIFGVAVVISAAMAFTQYPLLPRI
ncbi:hypothetical protein CEP54_007923 [Fusarium duplospermum]|uniref:Uncharacterized protein n=1 Tax=Fusarium duplospermum TaxID=1325734 RepID=A0A428PYS9_9HYPO|nr:hypothetical protein CEP54_007923 [Fusarium duplospermum]